MLVALLDDLDHGAFVLVGRLGQERLVDMRVELPVGLDLREALLGQQIRQGAMHQPHPFLELRLFVLRRRLERAAEVVEDGNQLLDEALVRALAERRLLAGAALAEVVELRREPLQAVEELVALGLESLDIEALLSFPRPVGDLMLVGHLRLRSLLLLVDDLVVGLLDDLVVGGRGAVTGRRLCRRLLLC